MVNSGNKLRLFFKNICCIVPITLYFSIMILNSVAVYVIHFNLEKDDRISEMISYVGLIDMVKRGDEETVKGFISSRYIEDYAVIECGKSSKIVSSTFLYSKKEKGFEEFLKYKRQIDLQKKEFLVLKDKNLKYFILAKTTKNRYVLIYFNNEAMEKRRKISTLLSLINGLIYFAASIPIFYAFKKKMDRKNSEIEAQAMTDYLTGLYNRRACFIFLNKYINLSQRNKTPLSVVFIDVDGLKETNDLHGHDSGDRLIKSFAETAKQNLRSSDIFARIGGDEFLLILSGCNTKDAKILVEKIKQLCDIKIKENGIKIEFSYGIAESDISETVDADKLVKIADNRMYQSKIIRKYNKKIAENLSSEDY